jgi:hypothetical protein
MSAATIDLLRSTLLSLIEVTRQLCSTVQGDDLSSLQELLDRREKLLEQQSVLLTQWKDLRQDADNIRGDLARLKPLSELLQTTDHQLRTLVVHKKDEVAEQLRQAQNQKQLLAYSR